MVVLMLVLGVLVVMGVDRHGAFPVISLSPCLSSFLPTLLSPPFDLTFLGHPYPFSIGHGYCTFKLWVI